MSHPDTVMFAIQAGLRLYGAVRKAYADSVRGRALILPLPRTPGVAVDSAENWFRTSSSGKRIRKRQHRINWLVQKSPRTKPEGAELVDLYSFYWSSANPDKERNSRLARNTLDI